MTSNDNTTEQLLSERLSFMDIDDKTLANIRSLSSVFKQELPKVLDSFYRKMRAVPQVSRLFASEKHIEHAKEAQLRHWDEIISANYNRQYAEGAARIGRAHARVGLLPRWYVGGYKMILMNMISVLIKKHFENGKFKFFRRTNYDLTHPLIIK